MSLIVVERLQKTYQVGDENIFAVKDVTLRIEMGEFVAIIGPSGSGKSTFLSTVAGLTRPSGGRVKVDGIDIFQLTPERRADFRREYLGFVFQAFHLIPYLSVLENVQIPLAVTPGSAQQKRKQGMAILDRVGLAQKAARLPNELSGGEQERVAIARALINNPPIIMADEPTGNLDSATGEEIMNLFRQLNEDGQTILMVTHNMENLGFARRCITLRDGVVIEDQAEMHTTRKRA